MRKQKDGQNKYSVTYDKAIGGTNTMVVIAMNDNHALQIAQNLRFTGSNFRDAVIVDWSTESTSGNTQGCARMN